MRSRALIVLMLVAALVVVRIGHEQPEPAEAAPVSALLVGDSVMNGLAQSYGANARATLAARHAFLLEAASCRRLITTSCSIGSSPRPSNALSVVRARAGQYADTLVVAAGYNDPSTGSVGVATAIDVLIAEAAKSGIDDIVWLTYREAGSSADVALFRSHNAVLRSKDIQYPQLRLADWNAVSSSFPTSWFSADGIHLGTSATTAMAVLIADTLDIRQAMPVRQSIRCAADRSTGEQPADAGPAGATPSPAMGAIRLLDTPVRVLDTRDRTGKVGADRFVRIPIVAPGAIPIESAATAAIVSVISVEPCAAGFVTAFPCGGNRPLASVLNSTQDSVDAAAAVANSAVVAIGDQAAICVYTSSPTDLVVDLTGYVANGGDAGLLVAPVPPARLVDTRRGNVQLLDVAQRRFVGGLTIDMSTLSADLTEAVTINIVAVDPAAAGFVSVIPGACTGTAPTTSVLNMASHRTIAALTVTRLQHGHLCVYSNVETDLVIDLQAILAQSAGFATVPVLPSRLYDSRATIRLDAGVERRISGLGVLGAVGAVVNVTVVEPISDGFVSLYPCGGARPVISNVNSDTGSITANLTLIGLDGSGAICAFSSSSTDLVIDVEAWLVPPLTQNMS